VTWQFWVRDRVGVKGRVRVVGSSGFVFISTGIARTNRDYSNGEIFDRIPLGFTSG